MERKKQLMVWCLITWAEAGVLDASQLAGTEYRAWSGSLFTDIYICPASSRPARKGKICKSVDRNSEKTEAWNLERKDSRYAWIGGTSML